jgi:hypothetical protein
MPPLQDTVHVTPVWPPSTGSAWVLIRAIAAAATTLFRRNAVEGHISVSPMSAEWLLEHYTTSGRHDTDR